MLDLLSDGGGSGGGTFFVCSGLAVAGKFSALFIFGDDDGIGSSVGFLSPMSDFVEVVGE